MAAALAVTAAALAGAVAVAPGAPKRSARPAKLTRVSGATPLTPRGCGVETGSLDYEWEPSVAVDPRRPRRIVVAWIQDDALGAVVAATHDGGRHWRRVALPGLSRCTGASLDRFFDPRIKVAPDGTVYLSGLLQDDKFPGPRSTLSEIVVSRSHDGGFHWSQPAVVEPVTGQPNDFDTLAVESRPGRADVIWSRRLLDATLFSRTVDGGRTWSPARVVRKGGLTDTSVNHLVALGNGTLLDLTSDELLEVATGVSPPSGSTELRSTDHGATWSGPTRIPGGEVDDVVATGRTAAFALVEAARAGGGVNLGVIRTRDSGRSWTTPRRVTAIRAQRYKALPVLAVAPSGGLAVVYDGAVGGGRTDVWLLRSRDGGRTWARTRLAGPFDQGSVPGGQLGDYQGIAPLGSRGFVAAAAVGRPPARVGPTDIELARIAALAPARHHRRHR